MCIRDRIFGEPIPEGTEARRDFCLRHHIALWDVLASCVISGAADGSIREPKANSIETLLQFASIKAIFTTGRKAYDLYNRFCLPNTGKKAFLLPSTSPANCACSLADLKKAYRVILPYCQAVSYTHLDVYKRQEQGFLCEDERWRVVFR